MKRVNHNSHLNPVWAFRKAVLVAQSKWLVDPADIVLAMYPKTGSTWIRFFLFNLLDDLEGTGFGQSIDRMNEVMPEFAHSSIKAKWPYKTVPRLIKTHRPCSWLTAGHRTVLVVRDPRDIAVSYYHYVSANKEWNFSGQLTDVINDPKMGFEYFFKFYNSWKKDAKYILKYEDIRANPESQFKQLCHYLGLEVTDLQVKDALNRSDMSSMRKAQQDSEIFKNKFRGNYIFARSGGSGEWRELFGEAELELWKTCVQKHNFQLYK